MGEKQMSDDSTKKLEDITSSAKEMGDSLQELVQASIKGLCHVTDRIEAATKAADKLESTVNETTDEIIGNIREKSEKIAEELLEGVKEDFGKIGKNVTKIREDTKAIQSSSFKLFLLSVSVAVLISFTSSLGVIGMPQLMTFLESVWILPSATPDWWLNYGGLIIASVVNILLVLVAIKIFSRWVNRQSVEKLRDGNPPNR